MQCLVNSLVLFPDMRQPPSVKSPDICHVECVGAYDAVVTTSSNTTKANGRLQSLSGIPAQCRGAASCRVFQNLPGKRISLGGSRKSYTTLHHYTTEAPGPQNRKAQHPPRRLLNFCHSCIFWTEQRPFPNRLTRLSYEIQDPMPGCFFAASIYSGRVEPNCTDHGIRRTYWHSDRPA